MTPEPQTKVIRGFAGASAARACRGKPRNQPAGNPATVAALPVIIRFFRAHGYRFVRV